MKIEYIKSAVLEKDYPVSKLPEVAFAGRSNAGKSSLINTLSQSRIAKVSGTPGKTRLLNFFNFNNKYVLVDMPGYGFASRGGDEIHDWQKMIEDYLMSRRQLVGLILVMDIRRKWTEDEELLKQFSEDSGFNMAVVLTKTDKMTRNEMLNALKNIKKAAGLDDIFLVSALKKTGHEELEDFIYKKWVAKYKKGGRIVPSTDDLFSEEDDV